MDMSQTEQTPAVTATGLTPKQAVAALQFLQRTQLQGAEMHAYVDIFNTLTALANTAPDTAA